MLITEISTHVKDVTSAILFLSHRHILASIPPACPQCARLMTKVKRNDLSDGVVWRCPSHKGSRISIRKNSFLENSHLTLPQFIYFIYFWANNVTVTSITEMLGLSERTVIDWCNFTRNVCSNYLQKHPYTIGGVGHIVEIDESAVSKRKYHVGHQVPERWVFGGYDTTTKIGFIVTFL
jgi:transposase-like protein